MRIVVVSPFPAERIALQELLADDGHQVIAVATRCEGLSLVLASFPEVIIVDVQVVGYDCLGLLQELANCGHIARVIFLCPRVSWKRHGSVCLIKPIDLAQLHRHIAPQHPNFHRAA